jgi:hypothetical protein
MSKVEGKCSACEVPLELAVTEPFAGTELAAALCPACTDRQFLAGGGAILERRAAPKIRPGIDQVAR